MFASLGTRYYGGKQLSRSTKLVLDFLGGMTNAALRTTRSGLGTCIGPDGTLQWGPHNLISESDTLLGWGTTAPVYTPFAVPAFDGRQIGARFTTPGGVINTAKGEILVSDSKVSLSCDVQRGNFDTDYCHIYGFYNQSTGVDLGYIVVNYLTGAILSVIGPQAATSVPYTKDLGNGWFRIGVTVTAGVSPGNLVYAYLGATGGEAPAGLQWNVARVMVNNGTSMEYVDSTVKNRCPYANDFVSGGAGWAKPAVNMYPTAATLADGTPMTLAVATAANAQHQFYVSAAAISGVATCQIMARDGGARYLQVLSAAVSDQYANFDLQTGAVTTKGAGCLWAGAVWINGAWCCAAQFNGTAATFYYSLANSPTAGWLPTFTGDGINGVFIANACTLPGTGVPSYGLEKVTNGTNPTVTTSWSATGVSVAAVSSEFQVTRPGQGWVSQAISVTVGKTYVLTATARKGTSNLAYLRVSSGANGVGTWGADAYTSSAINAPLTLTFVPAATTVYVNFGGQDLAGTGFYNNISVREVTYGPIPYFCNPGPAPTPGPIYAQRTDYDVSTISGIGPDLLGGAGSFDSAAGWALGAGWSIDNGVARAVVASGILTRQIALTAGKAYLIEVSNPDGAAFQVRLGGVSLGYRSSTTISLPAVATSSLPLLELVPNGPVTCSIDNITVQEAFSGKIAGYGPDLLGGIGTFDSATGWTLDSGMSVSGGVLVATGAISKNAVSAVPVVVGRSYIATWDQTGTGVNDTRINIKSPLDNFQCRSEYINGTGPKFAVFTASVSGSFALFNYAGGATYDNLTVKEIIFASKGALIEPTQATQLLANPDDLSNATNWIGNCTATDDGTKFRGRRFWKLTKTTAGTSEARLQTAAGSQSIGSFTQGFAFLASSSSNQADFGLLGGTSSWGLAGSTACSIISGPGTLSQVNGGQWRIVGLSTNVPTVITMTRSILVVETVGVYIYPGTSISTTIGHAIYAQVDNLEAGTSPTSFIPNPATSGTVVRVADTSSVGYDDLCKALPWLMDANTLSYPESLDNAAWLNTRATITPDAAIAPDGTMTADKLVGVNGQAGGYFYRLNVPVTSGAPNTQTIFLKAGEVTNVVLHSNMTGSYKDATLNLVTGAVTFNTFVTPPTMTPRPNGWWRMTLTEQASVAAANILYIDIGAEVGDGVKGFYAWGGTCAPGPVAQTYYPQSSKQGTIVFEGDLTYGSTAASIFSLENTAANRVLLYKPTAIPTVYGYINGNGVNSNQVITSGVPFKAALGFSLSSAGITANGSSEMAIAPGAFALAPNILRLANDATGNGSGSVHLRALKILNVKPLLSTQLSALSR